MASVVRNHGERPPAGHPGGGPSSQFVREWIKAQDSVLAFICSLIMDFADSEDLLQETAAKVFANASRYDPARPFLPWVLGIARHVVMDHRRSSVRGVRVFDHDVMLGLAEAFELASDRNDPIFRALSMCRERLTPRSQDVLRLRYEDNLSPAEIAARCGERAGMVRALLHRVRQQLRECIEQRLRAEGAPT